MASIRWLCALMLAALGCWSPVRAANILAVFPSDYRSHFTLGRVLFSELAQRGHQLTIFSQFALPPSHQHANITEIRLAGVAEHFIEQGLQQQSESVSSDQSVIDEIINLIYGTAALVNFTLSYPEMQAIIRSKESKFDLLLIDMYFTDGLLGLAHYWQIPAVVVCSTGTNKWTNEMVGNPHNPAYNPSIFLGYTDRMSLTERLVNALASGFEKITYNYMYLPSQEIIYERYFSPMQPADVPLPPLIDLIHNVSLILLNSHTAMQYPRPSSPNMLHVGGMHLNDKNSHSKPLSEDITNYIGAAPDGVIFISLGNVIRSADLPADKIDAFVKVFSKFMGKMRIIWKWENATLINHPKNVIIGPEMPQQAILAHPNVKLFITNGGSLSMFEAMHAAVPVVGIPMHGDQYFNVAQAVRNGLGISLDYANITEASVEYAINDVLNTASYRENAVRMRDLLADNPIDPLDNAIYGIEYVLRTKGAKHLRSPAVDLSLLQQSLVDVALLIVAGVVLILAIPSVFICFFLRRSNAVATQQNGRLSVKGGKGDGDEKSGSMRRHKKKQL